MIPVNSSVASCTWLQASAKIYFQEGTFHKPSSIEFLTTAMIIAYLISRLLMYLQYFFPKAETNERRMGKGYISLYRSTLMTPANQQ